MRYEIIALAAVLVAILVYMYRRDRRRLRDNRAAMYEDCAHLFDEPRVVQDDVNFPVLTGRYRGYGVKLEPIADYLAFRKIPSLWLQATVYCDNPYRGAFDFLVRPQNVEFWSPAWQQPVPGRVRFPGAPAERGILVAGLADGDIACHAARLAGIRHRPHRRSRRRSAPGQAAATWRSVR
jgi:hypothetical protein